MFKEFCRFFKIHEIDSSNITSIHIFDNPSKVPLGFLEILNVFQGQSFGKGLYRLHRVENITKWNAIVLEAFPEFKSRITCFGYDWLGRQFSLDSGRTENSEPQVLMFEPGTGEVLEIPCNFIDFHNTEIPNYHEACLASSFFREWLDESQTILANEECAGYKVPLFLGGEDEVVNLEKCDLEVYWSICAQLIRKTK